MSPVVPPPCSIEDVADALGCGKLAFAHDSDSEPCLKEPLDHAAFMTTLKAFRSKSKEEDIEDVPAAQTNPPSQAEESGAPPAQEGEESSIPQNLSPAKKAYYVAAMTG